MSGETIGIQAEHVRRNSLTRDGWDWFAPHRQHVTQLITGSGSPVHSRLCILGAGNCNDVDLEQLTIRFDEVTLVDLDQDALSDGIARQGVSDHAAIRCQAPVDLTGVLQTLEQWAQSGAPEDGDIERAVNLIGEVPSRPLPAGSFDVVASTCVLTQLIDSIGKSLGPDHPRLLEVIQAVRMRHLSDIVALLAPNGVGLLLSDLVSSDTCPELIHMDPREIAAAVGRLVEEQNFFTGVNPGVIHSLLSTDAELSKVITAVEPLAPWPWNLGVRMYAVYGMQFTIRG